MPKRRDQAGPARGPEPGVPVHLDRNLLDWWKRGALSTRQLLHRVLAELEECETTIGRSNHAQTRNRPEVGRIIERLHQQPFEEWHHLLDSVNDPNELVALVEGMIVEARKLVPGNNEAAARWIEHAHHLVSSCESAPERPALMAHSLAHRANFARSRGDLARADQWMGEAMQGLRDLRVPSTVEGEVLALNALLRRDQGRLDEAERTMARAVLRLASGDDPGLLARSLIGLASIYRRSERTGLAVELLATVEARLGEQLPEPVHLSLRHNRANALWRLGRLSEAAALMEESARLGLRGTGATFRAHHRWLEGRIAVSLGDRRTALQCLGEAFQLFRDRPHNALLVSMEMVGFLEGGELAHHAEDVLGLLIANDARLREEARGVVRDYHAAILRRALSASDVAAFAERVRRWPALEYR